MCVTWSIKFVVICTRPLKTNAPSMDVLNGNCNFPIFPHHGPLSHIGSSINLTPGIAIAEGHAPQAGWLASIFYLGFLHWIWSLFFFFFFFLTCKKIYDLGVCCGHVFCWVNKAISEKAYMEPIARKKYKKHNKYKRCLGLLLYFPGS